jgi:hypothetical protein
MPHNIVIEEPRIVCPTDPSYELPISIIDSRSLTQHDEELIQAMAQHRPRTRFKAGDYAYIKEIPYYLKRRHLELPQIWKIRFVITAWAFELMSLAMERGGNIGMDQAIALLDKTGFDPAAQNREPIIYAHGAPHGNYPNTAAWIPERVLRRLMFHEKNVPWTTVLHDARAPYYGYDPDKIATPYCFSLAPDDYSMGQKIGKPLQHEEDITHRMCLAGLEESLMIPIRTDGSRKRAALDRHHDVFVEG